MRWQRSLLTMLKDRKDKKVALAIDTSSNQVRSILINNIVTFFGEMNPESLLVQADYKIREVSPIKQAPQIKYFTHGKSSYTEVFEWAEKENIDSLFYITDVTGYFYEELKVKTEVFWLVPDEFLPKVPFGKAIMVA
ncbi:VWA-like domain-containing protein [Litchfieldia salsa]|uniref:VWA-like domain n=1 Tax=Litchfieldia salsa TaxID=930152 RepID=A0A1H0RNX5_9BACI|nr:VWA-like domain-containing protein [Litchfieldia salsa]SDP31173.1 VWA-like domain [Litchfieldia salsa]